MMDSVATTRTTKAVVQGFRDLGWVLRGQYAKPRLHADVRYSFGANDQVVVEKRVNGTWAVWRIHTGKAVLVRLRQAREDEKIHRVLVAGY